MFGIGSTEFLVILLVALLVLGPKSLATISRTVGKYMGEFRRVSTEFQRTLNAEVAEEERHESRESVKKQADAARAARIQREASASGTTKHPVSSAAKVEKEPLRPTDQETLAAHVDTQASAGSPLDEALRKAKAEAAELSDGGKEDATSTGGIQAANPTPVVLTASKNAEKKSSVEPGGQA